MEDYMDYKKHYSVLINRAKTRILDGYTEKHHIIPKCIGGSDELKNIVSLTPEEHYLAHQLLIKIYPDQPLLVYAAAMMTVKRANNKMYGWLKKTWANTISERQSGKGNSQFGTIWITNGDANLKIPTDSKIPSGWYAGRTGVKRVKPILITCQCGKEFTTTRSTAKYCSRSCSSKYKQHSLHTEESRIKMSILAKSRINNTIGTIWITNGVSNKRISCDYQIPIGWSKGRTNAQVSTLSTKQE